VLGVGIGTSAPPKNIKQNPLLPKRVKRGKICMCEITEGVICYYLS